ncbi:vhs [Paramyrothecium foliicola]|nr:vhs [Paramyrothecium foliicola]
MNVGKMLGSIRKKTAGTSDAVVAHGLDGGVPEAVARNNVVCCAGAAEVVLLRSAIREMLELTNHPQTAFCEAGGSVQGDEVLFLPPIVDATESSPTAASEAARFIRRFMGKDYFSRPSWQYNAVMLLRILADYPGPQFTKFIDDKFIEATTNLLKKARDPSLRQLLMETLDDMEHTKMNDQNLGGLIQMWKREKEKALKDYGQQQGMASGRPRPVPNFRPPMHSQSHSNSQNYFARSHKNNRLPGPVELASRLEEARTSAKLLEQVVMNTPPAEMLDNDLIKEFADRCLSASRSIQGYMVCENPAPDNETMESLIDTNEQLQTALNQHQRAVLSARKQQSGEPEMTSAGGPQRSTPSPPRVPKGKGKQADDPFADPEPNGSGYAQDRLAFEPFHPGFDNNGPGGSGSSRPAQRTQDYEVSDEDDLYERREPARRV